MKKMIAMTMFVLAANVAQARTVCGIQGENPTKEYQFDKSLYVGDLSGKKQFIVKKDNTVVELNSPASYDEYKKSQGETMVFMSLENNQISFTVGTVDFNSKHGLDMEATSIAPASTTAPAILMVPRKHLAISCSTAQ